MVARLAQPTCPAHSERVLDLVFRRAVSLVLILALSAGMQMRLMPMVMALPDTSMAGMTSDGSDACKGCAPGKMAGADCDAICATTVALLDNVQALPRVSAPPLRIWANDLLRTYSPIPDTDPPRS